MISIVPRLGGRSTSITPAAVPPGSLIAGGLSFETSPGSARMASSALGCSSFAPDPWVAPTLLIDDDFPNGVLSFATDRQFVDFYRALDGGNGSNTSATAALMQFSAEDTADSTVEYATLVVELSQGQILDAGTCGLAGAALDGNSFIRLVGADNVEVASNDDACDGQASRITYQAERAAAFELRLGCQGSTSCSGTLAYTIGPEPTPEQMLPIGFVSARDYLSDALQSEPLGDVIRDVDYTEFNDDLKAHLTEDEALRWLVDPELQVVVDEHVYQLTSMGVLQVDREVIQPLACRPRVRHEHGP